MKNRTIKFKAKRLDNGKWVEGDLLQHKDGVVEIGVESFSYIENEVKFYEYSKIYEVDPATVCQFIGLRTKDNIPIYEGDILSNAPFMEGEVSLYKGCFIVLSLDGSHVPLFEYINNIELNVVNLKHEGSKFDRKEGEK